MRILSNGSLLQGGKYRVRRLVSSSDFANVYEAEHLLLSYVVKISELVVGDESEMALRRDSFLQEARRPIDAQGAEMVMDVFDENGTSYIVKKILVEVPDVPQPAYSQPAAPEPRAAEARPAAVRPSEPAPAVSVAEVDAISDYEVALRPRWIYLAVGAALLAVVGAGLLLMNAGRVSEVASLLFSHGRAGSVSSEAVADSVEEELPFTDDFTSADLATFQLHGHVKRVEDSDGSVCCFDRRGVLVRSILAGFTSQIVHKDGRIKEIVFLEGEYRRVREYSFVGDRCSQVKETCGDWGSTVKYLSFDERGLPERQDFEANVGQAVGRLSYSNFDDKGNWRNCRVQYPTASDVAPSTLARTITYYTEEEFRSKDEVDYSPADKIYYRVLLFSDQNKLAKGDARFGGHGDVESFYQNGLYHYTVGESTSRNEINTVCDNVQNAFPQAVVIKCKNGQRTE